MDARIHQICSIASSFRKKAETRLSGDPGWKILAAPSLIHGLRVELEAAGFRPHVAGGTYVGVEAGFLDDLASARGAGWRGLRGRQFTGVWHHWWLLCEKHVIDVVPDQFHPGSNVSCVVLPLDDALAYRGGIVDAIGADYLDWLPSLFRARTKVIVSASHSLAGMTGNVFSATQSRCDGSWSYGMYVEGLPDDNWRVFCESDLSALK